MRCCCTYIYVLDINSLQTTQREISKDVHYSKGSDVRMMRLLVVVAAFLLMIGLTLT